jgi:hypothetical protein
MAEEATIILKIATKKQRDKATKRRMQNSNAGEK